MALGEGIEFGDGGEDGEAIGVHRVGGGLVDSFGGEQNASVLFGVFFQGVEPWFEGRCRGDSEAALMFVGFREDGGAVGEDLRVGEGEIRDLVEC